MKAENFLSSLASANSEVRFLRTICLVLSLCVLGLGYAAISKDVRTVVVPAEVKATLWAEDSDVSPEYLKQMAATYAGWVLNADPGALTYSLGLFLRYTYQADRPYLEKLIARRMDDFKANNARAFFTLDKVEVNTAKKVALISGRQELFVGERQIDSKPKKYFMVFIWNGSRLLVQRMSEAPHSNLEQLLPTLELE